MSLCSLPNELLFKIGRCLRHCPTCHCPHITADLSAFSRSTQHLHALLGEDLEKSSSHKMLLWGVANSQAATVTLALHHGADPNDPLCKSLSWGRFRNAPSSTMDLAIRMRQGSADSDTHARKLATLALLMSAGGICTIEALMRPTSSGDLDLLTLCLPYIAHPDNYPSVWTLLHAAVRGGHVEATKILIAAGAKVDPDGYRRSNQTCPPLWLCSRASIAVTQVLLDAGADAAWRSRDGVSVVQNVRRAAAGAEWLEEKIALLVRYGAVDEPAVPLPARRTCMIGALHEWGPRRKSESDVEYTGWVPGGRAEVVDWPGRLVKGWSEGGCIV